MDGEGTEEGEGSGEVREELLAEVVDGRDAQEVAGRHVRRLRAVRRHVQHVRDRERLRSTAQHTLQLQYIHISAPTSTAARPLEPTHPSMFIV